jgi:hypothetical protein
MTGLKTGGRIQGTPNKVTKDLRDLLKSVISNELETIRDRLDKLEPRERIEMTLKLMSYVMPKVQTLESSYDSLGGEW